MFVRDVLFLVLRGFGGIPARGVYCSLHLFVLASGGKVSGGSGFRYVQV